MLNGVLCPFEYLLYRVINQRVQPQPLDLIDLLRIGIGGVVLVVIVQAKQGEDLVDSIYMGLGSCSAATLILPRIYRRGLARGFYPLCGLLY